MLVTAMVHKYHSFIRLLVASVPWKLAWHLLVPRTLIVRKCTFRSVPAAGSPGLVSEVHGVFITCGSWGGQGQITVGCMLLGSHRRQLKRGFSCLVLLNGLCHLNGAFSAQMVKFTWTIYTYIYYILYIIIYYTPTYVIYMCLRSMVNSIVPNDLFRPPCCFYFPPLN